MNTGRCLLFQVKKVLLLSFYKTQYYITILFAVLVGALRTHAVTVMVTEWVVVLEAPCPGPVCHISTCGAWWCCQLIVLVAVVVATEPSDIVVVTAGEGHHEKCGPIKSDFNANISLDFAMYSSLCDGDAASFKTDRKLCLNTIHLWRERERGDVWYWNQMFVYCILMI